MTPETIAVSPQPRSPLDRSPALLSVASALLTWATFPPAEASWLAWVSLVPFFSVLGSQRPARSIYFGAWLGGLVFWVLAIQWIRHTDETAWLGWLVMATFLSLGWPLFVWLTRTAVLRLRISPLAAAPIMWVALELVRSYILTGFPWYYLAHSQFRMLPVIQMADLTGALGLSLLIALVNATLTKALLSWTNPANLGHPQLDRDAIRGVIVTSALLIATLAYGGIRLATSRFEAGPRIALMQTNIPQSYKNRAESTKIIADIEAMIARLAKAKERPDLLVWPETSYPHGLVQIAGGLSASELETQGKVYGPNREPAWYNEQKRITDGYLLELAGYLKTPMVVGVTLYDFARGGASRFNSAVVIEPGKAVSQAYHKLFLVPFGEYIPLFEVFPWLITLTPYRDGYVPNLSFGRETPPLDVNSWRYAVAICFEDTVARVVRRGMVPDATGRAPDVLLNLTNDGWFHGSPEHEMHLAVSVFRAVENRVPLARAVNSGISAIIDGNGKIIASLPKMTEDILSVVTPLDGRVSLYTRLGDWVGGLCLAACLAVTVMAFLGKTRHQPISANLPGLPQGG
ncbi:apolipoprotein N-acyltransferase [Isosphaeraceae bacterium EP7]